MKRLLDERREAANASDRLVQEDEGGLSIRRKESQQTLQEQKPSPARTHMSPDLAGRSVLDEGDAVGHLAHVIGRGSPGPDPSLKLASL